MKYDLQTISDYLSIRDLCARYNRYADVADGENYASLFTEDAEFHIVGNRIYRGHAEIAAACRATQVTGHITADPLIEFNGDTASQRSRIISAYRAPDCSRNEFVATGWYIDELKRTPEGWRFHRRRVELDLKIEEVFRKMTITDAFADISAKLETEAASPAA
jgi:3-phenylpropionate/cinnamic acid dioxygenase small subunit